MNKLLGLVRHYIAGKLGRSPNPLPYVYQRLISEFGFRITEISPVSPSFGNRFVILTNDLLRLCVVLDRGWWGIDVSDLLNSTRSFPLGHLMVIVMQLDPTTEPTEEEQIEFLGTHLSTIAELVSEVDPEKWTTGLDRIWT
jgi:hypothetical protein